MSRRRDVREVTVLIHGVRSEGRGFRPLTNALHADDAFPFRAHRVKLYEYGHIPAVSTWFPGVKHMLADGIGGYLHKQKRKYPNLQHLNVVAHSFGSWGLCRYLRTVEGDELTVDNVITLGCVAPRQFPWTNVIHHELKVGMVFNFISRFDVVPMWAPVVGMGTAGDYLYHSGLLGMSEGFQDEAGGRVHNMTVAGGHGWYTKDNGVEFIRSLLLKCGQWTGAYTEAT